MEISKQVIEEIAEIVTQKICPEVKRIGKYTTLSSKDKDRLKKFVNHFIKKGWQPFGNPYMYAGEICQAMVKY